MKLKQVVSKNLIYIIIILGFFITRLLFLDEDLPPWGMINYQPVDEGAYSMMALNEYNYGQITPKISDIDVKYITSPHIRTNIIGNLLVYASLKTFGDNYWGLRASSVLCGFLILIFLFLILRCILDEYGMTTKKQTLITVCFLVYILFDFNFLMACRVVEPSIYRSLFVVWIVYAYLKIKKSVFLKFMVMSGLTTLSVFGVYITNVFLYFSLFLLLIGVGVKYGKQAFMKGGMGIISGVAIMLIPLEVYYKIVWNTYAIKNLFAAISGFSSQDGYEVTSSWWVAIRSTIHFAASNVNLYDIGLLCILLISFPYLIYVIVRKKNLTIYFLLTIIFSLYLQTLVSEDYIVRKYIVIYPIILFILCIVIAEYENIKDIIINNRKRTRFKVGISIYSLLCITGCVCIFIFRFLIISDGTNHDFSNLDISAICITGGGALALALLTILLFLYKGKLIKEGVILFLICVFSTHIYLDSKYVFFDRHYTEKQCMIDIGKVVGNNYVIGSFFPIGFTLYNDIKPIITSTESMVKVMELHPEIWCLDYTDKGKYGVRGYLDTLFADSSYELVNKKEFKRDFLTFGIPKNVALYKVKLKNK